MRVSAHVQRDLRKRATLDTTWMAKCSELRESPNVLCAFSKQELTMKLHAQGFCQVLSSEDFIFLVFFFRGAGLETWWLVNQKHNKLHYLLKIRLSCFKHWVTTWNETPSCRWDTGWLHNPGRQLLFFLMKQPRLWFYGQTESEKGTGQLPSGGTGWWESSALHCFSFLHALCWVLPSFLSRGGTDTGWNTFKMKSLTLYLTLVTSSHLSFWIFPCYVRCLLIFMSR